MKYAFVSGVSCMNLDVNNVGLGSKTAPQCRQQIGVGGGHCRSLSYDLLEPCQ